MPRLKVARGLPLGVGRIQGDDGPAWNGGDVLQQVLDLGDLVGTAGYLSLGDDDTLPVEHG